MWAGGLMVAVGYLGVAAYWLVWAEPDGSDHADGSPGQARQAALSVLPVLVVAHAVLLVWRAAVGTSLPGFADSLSALSLGLMVAVAWSARSGMAPLGAFLMPVAVVLQMISLAVPGGLRVAALAAVGTSWWLPVHVGLVLAAVTAFVVEIGVVLLHEVVRRRLKRKQLDGLGRLPALDTLAAVQERSLAFGLVCLGLGLLAGAGWAAGTMHHADWVADPKVVLSGVVWALYGGSLFGRRRAGRPTRLTGALDLVAFLLLLFSVAGLDIVAAGFHAYGG